MIVKVFRINENDTTKIQPMMNIIVYGMSNFFLSNAANNLENTRKCMFFRVQPESIEVYAND